MKYCDVDVVFQEVPGEVSLIYTITGCKNQCKNCHSSYTWDPEYGKELTKEVINLHYDQYNQIPTCICFLGGEWYPEKLEELLIFISQELKLKTALYTGLEKLNNQRLLSNLHYLKVGPWIEHLGGLSSENTNQRFFNLKINKDQTYLFKQNFKLQEF